MRERGLTDQERRRQARALSRGDSLRCAREQSPWQLTLLGTAPDNEVARRIGRTPKAAQVMRSKRGIPNPSGPGWIEGELALLGTAPDAEVAAKVGRTEGAVTLKRCLLGIPTYLDRRKRDA
jgi:hypothetical protein